MTFEEYMKQAKRTMNISNSPLVDSSTYELLNATLGLCGEAGEFAELVKKHVYHLKPWNREQAISEMGDILFYLAFAAECVGVSLDTVAYANIEKLQKRYPEGFVPGGGNRDGQ